MTIHFDQTHYLSGAPAPDQLPPDTGAEVAFAGRSNAGKSSVINTLCNRKKLAYSGKTPGVTRMIHFFETQPGRRLADLPGYGFANTSKNEQQCWQTLMEHYLKRRGALCGVILATDIRHALTDLDKRMIDYISEHPLLILLTKRDKLKRNRVTQVCASVRDAVPDTATVLPFSKNTATDAEPVRDIIVNWWQQAE